MNNSSNDNLVETEFGWATSSPTPPDHRRDLFWQKTPEGHLYLFEGEDGWVRFRPSELEGPAQESDNV